MTDKEEAKNSDYIYLTETVHDDIIRISLEGRFDANNCAEVEKFIRERVDKGACRLVLDMEKVPFIASAGLRVVILFAKGLRRKNNGDVRIARAQPAVTKVFSISGLYNTIKFFDSTEEAIRSFAN